MGKGSLRNFRPLLPAEYEVVARMGSGEFVALGDGELPARGDETRRLRAAFVRFLCLGGDHEALVHEKGVRIKGAWIEEPLDLEGCRMPRDVGLVHCHFDAPPVLRSAVLDNLFLNGSDLPGLGADRLDARGGVFLLRATARGEVCLLGAQMGGKLACDGAKFERPNEPALNADRLDARGGVFLRRATACGEVRLLGARLGGNLSCSDATFERPDGPALNADGLDVRGGVFLCRATVRGEARLPGARLGRDLACEGATFERPGGRALNLDKVAVEGTFFLRKGASIDGVLDLTAATFGTLCDDPRCWPQRGKLVLDRCQYGAIVAAPVGAADRLRWLGLQYDGTNGETFFPQPYEHLAKVLREKGHRSDAREVLIEKERRQRAARRLALGGRSRIARNVWDMVLDQTIRYGHRSMRAFLWLFSLFVVGTAIFGAAEASREIKPNNPFVLRSAEWVACAHQDGAITFDEAMRIQVVGRKGAEHSSQLDCFFDQAEAKSYPRFNALIYSADTLLPIVSLEMQEYWLPDETRGWVGAAARAYLWLHIALGWALSLLAVAGFSGLVKSD